MRARCAGSGAVAGLTRLDGGQRTEPGAHREQSTQVVSGPVVFAIAAPARGSGLSPGPAA